MINVILACASTAVAGSVWNGPAATETTTPAAAVAQAAGAAAVGLAEAGSADLAPSNARACVYALSKNICQSELNSQNPEVDGCPNTGCRTIYVRDGSWRVPIVTNRQRCTPCSGPGQCDETERLDGNIAASVQWTMRYNGPCPFRGCIEGRWQHLTQDGVLYQGIVTGTMGAGTHRFNQQCCDTSADRTCERCLDVEFIPYDDPTFGVWRIGVEATFEGRAINTGEPIPDKMHFSVSGDLFAEGTKDGPYVPQAFTWRFVGTADGVHVDYCN